MIAEERVAEGLVCCGEAWSGRSKRCGLGGAVVGRLVEGWDWMRGCAGGGGGGGGCGDGRLKIGG